ncbi:MAG: hypothetical protein ACE5QV_05760, partial [Fidelibacterota bacterium]
AYLESPGNPYDGIDNDEDGIVDERRDDGMDNDGDWDSFTDLNGNGVWDPGEPLNDDVGEDGVGPLDPQYPGPDMGEGDGLPTAGEPDFDATDKDESDQIGLTSVKIFKLHQIDLRDDEKIWNYLAYGVFDTTEQYTNLGILFASGPFPLKQGDTERFSMAFLFGEDLDDLIRNKNTVQRIYNANYNFAKPPLKPTVKAYAGDGRVTLYWDRMAEFSRDPFLGYKEDFEGYVIYKSTDWAFLEAKIITDSYGNKTFRKPVAQFDLIDGIVGPDPVGVHGARFNRGSDTGLRHSWTDYDVENGQTYYYAVVSYDQGDPELGEEGLPPTECTSIIRTDEYGNVTTTDVNTVVVTPGVPAAGYKPPEIFPVKHIKGPATGKIDVELLDPSLIKDDHTYRIIFDDTLDTEDKIIFRGADDLKGGDFNPDFDGMRILARDDSTVFIDSLSGWISGSSNYRLRVEEYESAGKIYPYPADYVITFSDDVIDTSSNNVETYFTIFNMTEGRKSDFLFKDLNGNGRIDACVNCGSGAEFVVIQEYIDGTQRKTWKVFLEDTAAVSRSYESGDSLFIFISKPFRGGISGDVYEFKTRGAYVDKKAARSELDRIAVVPNPYVAAATWEPKHYYMVGRGRRKIDFIHLPQKATIRIYTFTGELVDTIYHESTINDGVASWDLKSKDGLDIAYGIYFYHVEAPGIGEKTGKFAIIK